MLPTHLQHFADQPIKVLDLGSIQLIDVLGDDQAITNAARISYGAGTKRISEDRKLLRHLMREEHTSPFEMCEIVLKIEAPIMVFRQLVRHRTASINETSSRYSIMEDRVQQTDPAEWRVQATNNKQGSDGFLEKWPEGFLKQKGPDTKYENGGWVDDHNFYADPGSYLTEKERQLHKLSREIYEERLKFGVAREQARKDLPLSLYSTIVWKMDLRNLLHFLKLRLDSHAQLEIRKYAEVISDIVKEWVPMAWEAFEDYELGARKFSRMEMLGLERMLKGTSTLEEGLEASGLEGRELKEFGEKLRLLIQ